MNIKPTLHMVIWGDAHYNTGEFEPSEIYHEPWGYTTVGILVRSDEKGVTVASDIGQDGRVRTTNFIPRAIIIHEYSLGPLKPRKNRKKSNESSSPPPSLHS